MLPRVLMCIDDSRLMKVCVYLLVQMRNATFSVILAIPRVAIEPANDVQPMLAVVIPKVALHELRLHCRHELWIPAALDFDDERESFIYFLSRMARHCINADIDALIRTDD